LTAFIFRFMESGLKKAASCANTDDAKNSSSKIIAAKIVFMPQINKAQNLLFYILDRG